MFNKTIRATILVVVTSMVVIALGITFASGHRSKHAKWPISAFAGHPSRAHSAAVTPSVLSGDSGVVLAAVKGANDIYISHGKNARLDCFYDHISAQAGGGDCARSIVAESRGMVGVLETAGHTTRVLALLPDGVTNVIVTNQDGSSHSVTVENNVAVYEDASPATVSYTLPNGMTQTENVKTWATPLTDLRPSPAGSSE